MSRLLRPSQPPRRRVEFPEKLRFLFEPARYKVAHGGRGSAKSWSFARALVLRAALTPTRVLCGRELQVSIADSVHQLLVDQIGNLGLTPFFKVTQKSITVPANGSSFVFSGLRDNITKVKSMEGIDIVWVEEAERVSERSWQVLIPTVRKPQSEIWVSFNPDLEDDPTYQRFIKHPPPDARIAEVNWQDNPWFPEELRREKDYLYSVDADAADHVWGGKPRSHSDAQIFKGKWVVQSFEPQSHWDGPYYGADWGFANDPTALVRLWIGDGCLWVEHEAWGLRVDIDKTPELFDQVPGARASTIRADSARPETISYMNRHGYGGVVPVEKWAGSVEDGITVLRGFERIVIHPRCPQMAQEAKLYNYKVDRLTSKVLPEVLDRHNHCWDAVRYALNPLIRQNAMGLLDFFATQAADAEARRKAAAAGAPPEAGPPVQGPDALIAAMRGTTH